MKLAINLLPPEPEAELKRAQQKKVVSLSVLVLALFLLINLFIFGYYLFLTKSTADTLAATKREEAKMTALSPVEGIYRSTGAKLLFLATIWQKKVKPEDALNFSQSLLTPQVAMTRIAFKQGGLTTLTLVAADSGKLEEFLNKVAEEEKKGKIKDSELVSSSKNKDGGYDFFLSFKFLKL